jgi:hypothetical protein
MNDQFFLNVDVIVVFVFDDVAIVVQCVPGIVAFIAIVRCSKL